MKMKAGASSNTILEIEYRLSRVLLKHRLDGKTVRMYYF
jgi:hypothetical protein